MARGEVSHLRLVQPDIDIDDPLNQFEPSKREIKQIPLNLINTFSQIRPGRNPQQQALSESIAAMDIDTIHPISGAVIGLEMAEDYITFTNQTWGSHKSVDSLEPIPKTDDTQFIAAMAGHSRLIGVKAKAHNLGIREDKYRTDMQFFSVATITDFVDHQCKENIHAGTPTDRTARVIAEAFLWEKQQNPKLTHVEFARGHDISPDFIGDAINYTKLPPAIRQLCDDGGLPFTIAIELARALDPIRTDVQQLTVDNGRILGDSIQSKQTTEELVELELLRFVSGFNTSRKVAKSIAQIRRHVSALNTKQLGGSTGQQEVLALAVETVPERKTTLRNEIQYHLGQVTNARATQTILLHEDVKHLFGGDSRLTEIDSRLGTLTTEMTTLTRDLLEL